MREAGKRQKMGSDRCMRSTGEWHVEFRRVEVVTLCVVGGTETKKEEKEKVREEKLNGGTRGVGEGKEGEPSLLP